MAIGEESPGAQGKGPTVAVQGGWLRHLRVRLKHGGLLALLVLVGHFPVARLNAFFLHGEGPVDLVEERNQHLRICIYKQILWGKRCAAVNGI